MRDSAECQDRGTSRQLRQVGDEECIAIADLGWQRLVCGRQTLDRIGDPRPDQLQAIVDARRHGSCGETKLEQCCVQQQPGVIARERTPAGVSPMPALRHATHCSAAVRRTQSPST